MLRKLMALGFAPVSLTVAIIFACSATRVPVPEYKPHPKHAAEAACVPYPPPAPKPEETGVPPASMSKRAVWIDGEWVWHGRGGPPGSVHGRWEWQKGGWVEPPYGASYSRGTLERMPNGALAFYPPHWHMPDHYKDSYDAASPVSSEGFALDCPVPPAQNASVTAHDVGPEAHLGPVLTFPLDADLSDSNPDVHPDAVDAPIDTASEASEKKGPPKLIAPPD
ncbi:MAG: hypothetical protein ACXWVM_39105 [Polyangiales bacterium]